MIVLIVVESAVYLAQRHEAWSIYFFYFNRVFIASWHNLINESCVFIFHEAVPGCCNFQYKILASKELQIWQKQGNQIWRYKILSWCHYQTYWPCYTLFAMFRFWSKFTLVKVLKISKVLHTKDLTIECLVSIKWHHIHTSQIMQHLLQHFQYVLSILWALHLTWLTLYQEILN